MNDGRVVGGTVAAGIRIGPHVLANPWIFAPIAGASEMPFRRIVRRCGAAAAPTELVSAKGLIYRCERTQRYLVHDTADEPFWVQLFGSEPESMAEGALRAVELGAAIIDVNMGCPVRKVVRDGAGAALHLDVPRAARIIAAIKRRVVVPVTAKIRIGWDAEHVNGVELARAIAGEGVEVIAVHGRTRAQAYSGKADWSAIAEIAGAVSVPVIGNGDVRSPADAHAMMARTGCAAVMIGRAALGDPWIFMRLADPTYAGPSASERLAIVREHLLAHIELAEDAAAGVRSFRPQLMWYARGLSGAAEFRRHVTRIGDLTSVLEHCDRYFAHAMPLHAQGSTESADELGLAEPTTADL